MSKGFSPKPAKPSTSESHIHAKGEVVKPHHGEAEKSLEGHMTEEERQKHILEQMSENPPMPGTPEYERWKIRHPNG